MSIRQFIFDKARRLPTLLLCKDLFLEKTYDVRKPLHEIEILLDKKRFVRISQSETINIRKVKSFDFSIAGTIGVELVNGQSTWVARRRIRNVKELLTNTAPDNH